MTKHTICASVFAYAALMVANQVQAFTPTCESELAQAYPAYLKADLSVCSDAAAKASPNDPASLERFGTNLNGSWTLRSRTVQGVPVATETRAARLYFNMPRGTGEITGDAMLVLAGLAATAVPPEKPEAAFWSIQLAQTSLNRLAMTARGHALGPVLQARTREVSGIEFFEKSGVFASVMPKTSESGRWDRIVLSEDSLTYVSCVDGIVERYAKVSSQAPVVDGVSLREYWFRLSGERKSSRASHYDAPVALATLLSAP